MVIFDDLQALAVTMEEVKADDQREAKKLY